MADIEVIHITGNGSAVNLTKPTQRAICTIARDVRREWKNVYFGAVPYLQAMYSLDGAADYYGMDSAEEIVIRFLANASTFRGEKAKALKNELRTAVGLPAKK